jgi:hypothetical protein
VQFMSIGVLLTGLTVVNQGSMQQFHQSAKTVPVVQNAVVLFNFGQRPSVVAEACAPVTSLEAGLPHAQRASKRPILAMAESEHWFYYATAVGPDGLGRPNGVLVEGYAIKRGSRQVVQAWGGW